MKRFLIILLILFPVSGYGQWNLARPVRTQFTHSYSLKVDHTKVPSTQTNFTVLVFFTSVNLRDVNNGGSIVNTVTVNGQIVPADLVFSTSSGYGTLMSWEIESWDNVNGILVAWVLNSSLSSSVDPVFYMGVGAVGITTYRGGSLGAAWNANIVRAYHLPNGSSLSLVNSTSITSSDLSTVTTTPSAGAGQIGGGVALAGTGFLRNNTTTAGIPSGNSAVSVGIWFKMTSNATCQIAGIGNTASSARAFWICYNAATGRLQLVNQCTSAADLTTANNYAYFAWTYDANWHYMVATTSTSATPSTVSMYLDGTIKTLTTVGSTSFGVTVVTSLAGITTSQRFIGTMDEFRILSIQETADQITTEYNNQNSPSSFITTTLVY